MEFPHPGFDGVVGLRALNQDYKLYSTVRYVSGSFSSSFVSVITNGAQYSPIPSLFVLLLPLSGDPVVDVDPEPEPAPKPALDAFGFGFGAGVCAEVLTSENI